MHEKHVSVASLTPNQLPGRHPGKCPDLEWIQEPFGLQDDAQPTEPHLSGLNNEILCVFLQKEEIKKSE